VDELEIGANLASVLRQAVFAAAFIAISVCWYYLERHRAARDRELWERVHHEEWHRDRVAMAHDGPDDARDRP
jgi:hypothetical protein